ncbi:hypothetical protein [Croceimicrobium sp.]|uniref:hypothetical protein n=1 Tax=Croceimicrobium sp. TaxID=2828340 RepID=UPI003BA95514
MQWRFTNPKFDLLPVSDLVQLFPLNEEAAFFLWDSVRAFFLPREQSLNRKSFKSFLELELDGLGVSEIQKWLRQRGLMMNDTLYLSWNQEEAMQVPGSLFVKYFDSFYYSASDDLTVFDESLNWILNCVHYHQLSYGLTLN